jgi:hypothetical protein
MGKTGGFMGKKKGKRWGLASKKWERGGPWLQMHGRKTLSAASREAACGHSIGATRFGARLPDFRVEHGAEGARLTDCGLRIAIPG